MLLGVVETLLKENVPIVACFFKKSVTIVFIVELRESLGRNK